MLGIQRRTKDIKVVELEHMSFDFTCFHDKNVTVYVEVT